MSTKFRSGAESAFQATGEDALLFNSGDLTGVEWFLDYFGFFFQAQYTKNWTGLTQDQQDKSVNLYFTQRAQSVETIPVQLSQLLIVSNQNLP